MKMKEQHIKTFGITAKETLRDVSVINTHIKM